VVDNCMVDENGEDLGVDWLAPSATFRPVDPISVNLWSLTNLLPTNTAVAQFRTEVIRLQSTPRLHVDESVDAFAAFSVDDAVAQGQGQFQRPTPASQAVEVSFNSNPIKPALGQDMFGWRQLPPLQPLPTTQLLFGDRQAKAETRLRPTCSMDIGAKTKAIKFVLNFVSRWHPESEVSFERHCRMVERFTAEAGAPLESIFPATLGEKAFEAYDALSSNTREDYVSTKHAMLDIFEGDNRLSDWEQQFLLRRQMEKEPTVLYRVSMMTLARNSYPTASQAQLDGIVCRRMWHGLRPDLKDRMDLYQPRNLYELDRLAQRVENNTSRRCTTDQNLALVEHRLQALSTEADTDPWSYDQGNGVAANSGCRYDDTDQYGNWDCGQEQSYYHSHGETQEDWWPELFPDQYNQEMEPPIRCFACNGLNHIARHCRQVCDPSWECEDSQWHSSQDQGDGDGGWYHQYDDHCGGQSHGHSEHGQEGHSEG
jgi:hypothetical protein